MKSTITKEFKKIDIDKVWAGHPVHFACERIKNDIFLAYYDSDRRLIVAHLHISTGILRKKVLPEILGWDSHNGVSIGIDSLGFIHVSANMHSSSLIYYKSEQSLCIEYFQAIHTMTDANEESCTYPIFMKHNNQLFFRYRSGKSGKGNILINKYNTESSSWEPIMNTALFDGESKRNAYPSEFFIANDFFHLVWVWRETPDCETNHSPCYAKTKDFISWYDASGNIIDLPIKSNGSGAIEILQIRSGLLNGNLKVGFDVMGRQIISYHRFDKNGYTQLYNVRFEEGVWKTYQTSNWAYRWDFKGRGAIALEIEIFPVRVIDGKLTQHWKHNKYGEGIWFLDDKLSIIHDKPLSGIYQNISELTNKKHVKKMCGSPDLGLFMIWETFPKNRDKKRKIFGHYLLSSQLTLYIGISKGVYKMS